MIDNVRTGQNISAHRQRLGWTQGELAGRLNVTHQAVSKWENGVAFPDIGTLYALSQLFGISMEALLTGEPAAALPPSQKPSAMPENAGQAAAPAGEKMTDSEEAPPSGSSAYNWDEIISLAPFASRDTLDQLIAQCEEACDRGRILDLAPFVHRDTIDRLICQSSDCADWDFILSLAPFASRDTLDQLIRQCETVCDFDHIIDLAPFVHRATVDRLVLQSIDSSDWDQIIALAPFASRDTLNQLVSQCESSCDHAHIHALAPFLGRDTVDRLILGSIGRSTPIKPSPCPTKHWQDGLAAWSEAQECQMEDAVAWAEEHEQQMEQSAHMAETIEKLTEAAMRKAERIAEREMERAARRAERIAEKQLDRAARHADRAIRYSDERRTQIADAVPACSDLDEYTDRIISLLYDSIDASDPIVGRFEEIRRALLNQNFSALNEYAQLLDEHIGPEWLEEYAALCPDGEIPPDSDV